MSTILVCPACGATMAVSRSVCGRCGRPLTFVDGDGFMTTTASMIRQDRRRRVLTRVFGVALAAALIVGTVWFVRGLRNGRTSRITSLSEVLQSTKDGTDEFEAARPAPVAAPAGEATPDAEAYAAFAANDLERALELSLDALRARPSDPSALNNAGQVLVALGRPNDAVPYLEQAVASLPQEQTYRFNLAVALSRAGDPDRSAALLREIAAAAPGDARVAHNLGLALRQLGQDAEAAVEFQKATAASPGEAPAWLGLGLSLDRLGRRAEAADALDKYLSLNPADADADAIRRRMAQLREPVPAPPVGAVPPGKAPR